MLRTFSLLTVCAFLLVSPGLALADDGVFVHEGFGSSSVGGDLGQVYAGGLFLKIGAGARVDNFSAEIFVGMNELRARANGQYHKVGPQDTTMLRYGAEGRYFIPTSKKLRLYMRGGLSTSTLYDDRLGTMQGRGVEYGTGAMFSTKVRALGFLFWPMFFVGVGPKVSLSLWTDLGGHYARLSSAQGASFDVRTSTWSAGFTLGGGF